VRGIVSWFGSAVAGLSCLPGVRYRSQTGQHFTHSLICVVPAQPSASLSPLPLVVLRASRWRKPCRFASGRALRSGPRGQGRAQNCRLHRSLFNCPRI